MTSDARWHEVLLSARDSNINEKTIDRILADIPFFSVGLLAFGVFTLFVVIKRVNVLSVHLFISVLLAFVAAILDLGQILSWIHSNNQDDDSATGLTTVSEVGFALSVGFRYLFFWSFAAARPRGESPPPRSLLDRQNNFVGRGQTHSGSWSRWGLPGFIMKWSTLALVLAIPLMQVIWRNVNAFNRYGPVYLVEAALEIITSAAFILKLILNLYLITATTRFQALLYYTAPILALLISLGLGISNSTHFTLSETSLGRLFQAIELYILLLFILIMTFYKVSTSRRPSATPLTRVATFYGLPEKPRESAFHVTPPEILTPEPIMHDSISETRPPDEDVDAARASNGSRLSAWMGRRFSRRQLSWDERRLWKRGDAEEGAQRTSPPLTLGGDSLDVLGPRVEESRTEMNIPSQVSGSSEKITTVPTALQQTSVHDRPKDVHLEASSTLETRPPDTFSLSSYYGRESPALPPPSMPFIRNTESPVYGLNGIIKRRSAAASPQTVSSVASFDELLRQQQELDNSIAALRLFASDDGPTSQLPEITPPNGRNSADQPASSTKGSPKHESGSGRSEFSLSSFPEPPEASTTPPSPGSLGPLRSRQKQSRTLRKDDEPTVPVINVSIHNGITTTPTNPPLAESEMFGGTSRAQRLDSAGTQYDVTSFIDDLMVPESGGLTGLTSAFRSAIIRPDGLSDVEYVEDSPTAIRDVHGYNRPIITDTAGISPGPLVPATASSGLLTSRLSRLSMGPGALSQNKRPVPTVTFEQPSSTVVSLPSHPRMPRSLPGVSEDVEKR